MQTLKIPSEINVLLPNVSDEEAAVLYGVLVGDGCLSRGKKGFFISITGHIQDDIAFFDKIQPLISKSRSKPTKYYFRTTQGKIEYNFSDKFLFLAIKTLGFPIGKKRFYINHT